MHLYDSLIISKERLISQTIYRLNNFVIMILFLKPHTKKYFKNSYSKKALRKSFIFSSIHSFQV